MLAFPIALPILAKPAYSRSKGIRQAIRKKYTEGRKLGTREEDNLFGSGGPGGHADPGASRTGDRTPFVVPLTMRVFVRILAARLPSPRTLSG